MKQRKIVFAGSTILALTMLTMLNDTLTYKSVVVDKKDNETRVSNMYTYINTDDLELRCSTISAEKETNTEEDILYKSVLAGSGVVIKKEKVHRVKKAKKKKISYTKEDLLLLAGVVENESGSDFISDTHQLAVASVVINRVKSDYYPDTISEVIYQKGQYAINHKKLYNPSHRSIKNAKYVLENGSILPKNCVFQSEFKQGDFVYKIFKTPISTTYICGKN